MRIPMPSPNHTNHERLFYNAPRNATAAYDAAEGAPNDPAAPNNGLSPPAPKVYLTDDQILAILALIKAVELSSADMTLVENWIEQNSDPAGTTAPAKDEPPEFPGKPKSPARVALDRLPPWLRLQAIDAALDARAAARKSFDARWPEVSRVKSL